MRGFVLASLMGLACGQFATSTIRACSVDADCRLYPDGETNDLLSTCTNDGLCRCATTGFSTYTPALGGATYNQCFRNTDTTIAATIVSTYMTMIWEEGDCTRISEFEAQFQTEVDFLLSSITAPNTPTATINHYCGVNNYGVLTLIQMDLRTTDLFDATILNLVTNLRGRFLTQGVDALFPVLRALKFESSLVYPVTFSSLHTAAGSTALCPHDGAVMAYFGTQMGTSEPCRAISCSDATLTLTDGYCVSNVGPPISDSDDALAAGAIAGIVIGCVAFICIIVIVIYCCCCKEKKNDDENAPDDEE
eukprot:TRINITY_DN1445_c3_g1_i1.p1 TRINITY_DN1445_c3_g1~~TRINITY_DN1445_c3_g1_i1.p1  ORF type:complete len:320 (+),score=58.00 TRINITY_DN1445_c3_g1_i1:41-961(+)